jgi:two-component system sensor histidine kinase BaeS
MKEGDAAVPVLVERGDEIGLLATTFNDMARRRQQLERQRTALVSDVAHELRTPVSNIRGWLEAAQDGLATPDPAFVASLLEEATLLHHVIDDLQDLSAAEVGELRLHPVRLDAVELLEQVAGAHRLAADQAGVALVVEGERGVALDADPMRLRQAVGNLVANAVRHSPAGATVTLRASAAASDAVPPAGAARGPTPDRSAATTPPARAGSFVAIDVIDRGEGIDPQHLPHVFDRFWRAEKSRNRRTGGSGLGLAIVRKLVEAHGGTVTVRSALGAGATFTIRLPAPQPQPPGGSAPQQTSARPPSPHPPNGSAPQPPSARPPSPQPNGSSARTTHVPSSSGPASSQPS